MTGSEPGTVTRTSSHSAVASPSRLGVASSPMSGSRPPPPLNVSGSPMTESNSSPSTGRYCIAPAATPDRATPKPASPSARAFMNDTGAPTRVAACFLVVEHRGLGQPAALDALRDGAEADPVVPLGGQLGKRLGGGRDGRAGLRAGQAGVEVDPVLAVGHLDPHVLLLLQRRQRRRLVGESDAGRRERIDDGRDAVVEPGLARRRHWPWLRRAARR